MGCVALVAVGALGWRAGLVLVPHVLSWRWRGAPYWRGMTLVVAVEVVRMVGREEKNTPQGSVERKNKATNFFQVATLNRHVVTSPPSPSYKSDMATPTAPTHTTAIPACQRSAWHPFSWSTQDAANERRPHPICGQHQLCKPPPLLSPITLCRYSPPHYHEEAADDELGLRPNCMQRTLRRTSQVLATTSPHARQDNGTTPSPPIATPPTPLLYHAGPQQYSQHGRKTPANADLPRASSVVTRCPSTSAPQV
ncbi:hypothetical protein H4582DRAFT_2062565 [Lactarius indigo]|nr:hypothetical protein H4582DRAFT_2062565 [Lactarius indigo]